jgi:hypothetical protein
MNMLVGAAKKSAGKGAACFPAEAGQFFDEVPKAQLKQLREEMRGAYPKDEWELVDGFDFPYEDS